MKDYIYQNTLVSKKQLKQLLAWSFTEYNSMQACSLADELKYLGVILDKTLSWSPQIENVKSKILRSFYVLRRARPFIDRDTAIVLYHTMVQSYIDYCHVIWLCPTSHHLKKLQILQNRA